MTAVVSALSVGPPSLPPEQFWDNLVQCATTACLLLPLPLSALKCNNGSLWAAISVNHAILLLLRLSFCYPAMKSTTLALLADRGYKIQRRARNFMDIKQKGPSPFPSFCRTLFRHFHGKGGCVRFCSRALRRRASELDSVPYLIFPLISFPYSFLSLFLDKFSPRLVSPK